MNLDFSKPQLLIFKNNEQSNALVNILNQQQKMLQNNKVTENSNNEHYENFMFASTIGTPRYFRGNQHEFYASFCIVKKKNEPDPSLEDRLKLILQYLKIVQPSKKNFEDKIEFISNHICFYIRRPQNLNPIYNVKDEVTNLKVVRQVLEKMELDRQQQKKSKKNPHLLNLSNQPKIPKII